VCGIAAFHTQCWCELPCDQHAWLQVEEAEQIAPQPDNGIFNLHSSEQLDALLTLNAEREVVLVAGLSWCRPCKSLTRPMEKLAVHYKDGVVLAKVMGDISDNTKLFFKNRLKVRAGQLPCTVMFGLRG
jgi:thioredoxin-like negative regulator of GroEL